ncbi:hypothetical protein PV04_09775 [Phialophora macrospora]|uniref:Uncharacterized protein n=1 Tax=Phialophora macrospora TaxID=1851006 RepID=A0A0D2F4S6_9EURO|nr:hypothetical protein PV04_09775 [Phialophora macrospora]
MVGMETPCLCEGPWTVPYKYLACLTAPCVVGHIQVGLTWLTAQNKQDVRSTPDSTWCPRASSGQRCSRRAEGSQGDQDARARSHHHCQPQGNLQYSQPSNKHDGSEYRGGCLL